MTSPAERLTGLLNYLEQVEKLRGSTAFSVPDEFFRAFQADIDGLPGVGLDLPQGGDDVWLSMPRLGEIPPPPPSAALAPWIDFPKSVEEPPRLLPEIVVHGGDEETRLSVQNFPGLSRLLDAYIAQHWTPWAVGERPRRRAIALYNRLFALQRRMQAGGVDTPLEMVWGMGMACWRPAGGQGAVAYPLITQSCELLLDEDTLELAVQPRRLDAVLELEPFVELAPGAVGALAAAWAEHLKNSEERPSPFDPASTLPFLKSAVTILDAGGRLLETPGQVETPEASEKLLIADRWVLFARRRSGATHLADLRQIRHRLKDNPEVPPALSRLTSIARPDSAAAGSSSTDAAATVDGRPRTDLHLPLPFNDQQRAVVEMLERNDGVVVEAPPGTGATQTIANLICHCLATGKRVLVTSPIESALTRTQHRIPSELRSLTVAVVGDERRGMRQLAQCIKHVSDRLKVGGAESLEREVAGHEARCNELRTSITEIDAKIRELAEGQTDTLAVDERHATAAELAREVIEQARAHDWLTDPLDPVTQREPRVTEKEVGELRAARISLGADLAHLGSKPPELASLPDEAALLELNRELAGARRAEALTEARTLLPLLDASSGTLERAGRLRELLRRRSALRAETAQDPFAWTGRLRDRFQAREDGLARDLVTAARSITLEELARRARQNRSIDVPADAELSDEVLETVARRAEGRFAFRLPRGRKDVKAVLDAITVDGEQPADAEGWERVAAELDHRVKARKLLAAWNAIISDCHLEPIKESGPRAFREMAERAEHVLRVHELVTRVEAPIRVAMLTVFPRIVIDELPEYEEASHTSMLESLSVHLDRERMASARVRLREQLRGLEDRTGPSVDALWRFLTTQVGRDDSPAAAEALALTWRGLLGDIGRIRRLAPLFATVERVAGQVEASGASSWAHRIRTVPALGNADAVVPSTWRDAWRWRVAVMRLGGLEGHGTYRQLLQRRQVATAELAKATRALVVDRVWLGVMRRMPERLRQALREYTHSLRALSRGEGVRSTRNRQIAATALAKANAALPCWLLPVWRVPELAPAELGAFDVVVVEEASRADLTALGAVLRGQQVVVVGDRRQLPPPASGIDERKRQDLADRLLAEQPHARAFAQGQSLFELARQMYANSTIAFREQYAGDPVIIEVANRDVYDGALEPLRGPTTAHRLTPSLVDVHVVGGHRQGEVNEAEALAIVADIETMLTEESLAGRSIGVASLTGELSARRIDELVCERIALRTVIDRKILVGTPATFQGCERSLMLLSLGLAPGGADRAASALPVAYYNAAAPRNVERMLLYRSIGAADLPADAPASRLVRRFAELAHRTEQQPAARNACQTDMERELFDALVSRGFRVWPRYPVGSIVIDLMVEGSDGRRFAVACDGDRPGGTEDWGKEYSRQLTLERLGWMFWRCFASSLILRREHVLEDLWGTLERFGIDAPGPRPAAGDAPPSSRTVHAALQALAPTLTNAVHQAAPGGVQRRRETPPK